MRNILKSEIPEDSSEIPEELEGSPADPELDVDTERLRSLLFSLGRRRSLRDPIAGTCEDLGLSPAQLHCLLWLGTDAALTMGELARRVGITEKTMTGIVDRLENSGHLVRERDTVDRRVIHVKLTSEGHALFRRIDSAIHRQLAVLLRHLDRTDREHLFDIFQKLHDRLGASVRSSGEEMK